MQPEARLSAGLFAGLALPVIVAPMFIVSGPEIVIAACRSGIIGTFPALNARPSAELARWLAQIHDAVGDAPYGLNLIVHASNPRLNKDLEVCVAHKVPLVITSVGVPGAVVDAVHGYGGRVFHDVTTLRHAQKAIESGVDGLILVAAGAGGHAGTLSPFAFVDEVRRIYEGPIVLAGAITNGRQVRAAQTMGADFAYMGTRFIATAESRAAPAYKAMLMQSGMTDIVYTSAVSGIPANFMAESLRLAGIDPSAAGRPPDFSEAREAKAWKDVWSAGHGVGSIQDVPSVMELVPRLKVEYEAA